MSLRKIGKILLYCVAGLLRPAAAADAGASSSRSIARPHYQAEIKEWVHAQTGYHIAFAHVSPAFRWYGPELYFDRLELRSKDDRRVLARAAGGRVAADIWQLLQQRQTACGPHRTGFAEHRHRAPRPDQLCAGLGDRIGRRASSLAALALDDLPAGKLAIRHAVVTMQNWNPALPRLTLQDVNLDVRRGDARRWRLPSTAGCRRALGGSLSIAGTARGRGDLRTLNWNALARRARYSFARMAPAAAGIS